MPNLVLRCISSLSLSARQAVAGQSGGGGSPAQAAGAECTAQAARLLGAALGQLPLSWAVELHCDKLAQLVAAAKEAAALLQRADAILGAEQQPQLTLAQAAATRSCAYLRCANLRGEGGPAAGEGVGSKKCR